MAIIEEIIRTFKKTHNVSAVARYFGIGPQRLIKILSSEGVIISYRHQRIMELNEAGVPVEDIAKQLHISQYTVKTYLPAKKPFYEFKLKNYIGVTKK